MAPTPPDRLTDRSIGDFGEQWTRYTANDGFYASQELFWDIVGGLLTPADIKDASVAEIGSGTGRIVGMLVQAGARTVYALEPSDACAVLKANTRDLPQVTCVQARGDALPAAGFDLVVSIGVLHHIPDPRPVVAAAYRGLRPGGKCLIWVYGHEGNGPYLLLLRVLKPVTTALPAAVLAALAWLLTVALTGYMSVTRLIAAAPLRAYLERVIRPLTMRQRQLVVFDQLNPKVARYYRGHEARALLADAGFSDVRTHHRHGYSWTVVGTR